MTDRRLHFLVAGVQKAGTSALFSYLAEHHDLQAPCRKELHVFDSEVQVDLQSPDAVIEKGFPPADGRLRFEATPITFYWPQALERVHRYRSDIRLILVFREPVSRAFSHWRMERARGLETEAFSWCIRQGRARFAGAHRVYSYVERGFYGYQLRQALTLFRPDQILQLGVDELAGRPHETLARVWDFLGVAHTKSLRPRHIQPHARELAHMVGRLNPTDRSYLQLLYRNDQRVFEALSPVRFPTG